MKRTFADRQGIFEHDQIPSQTKRQALLPFKPKGSSDDQRTDMKRTFADTKGNFEHDQIPSQTKRQALLPFKPKGSSDDQRTDMKTSDLITMNSKILGRVREFLPITARCKTGDKITEDEHHILCQDKFDEGGRAIYHITVFRVKDKRNLNKQEIEEHTVPGPVWTPPSSVAYVMGGLRGGKRVYSATKLSTEESFLRKGETPSILAREITAILLHGWLPRQPKHEERYENTSQKPEVVFTPPQSPRKPSTSSLRSIMDSEISWSDLPINSQNLVALTNPLPRKVTDFLKKFSLVRSEVCDLLIRMIENDNLSLSKLINAPAKAIRELLTNKEVIELLSKEEAQFEQLLEIYKEYIESGHNPLDTFSFKKFYRLLEIENTQVKKLFNDLGLTIGQIIKLHTESSEMFCAFASDKLISFFKKYSKEINIDIITKIYLENKELFYSMIDDDLTSELARKLLSYYTGPSEASLAAGCSAHHHPEESTDISTMGECR
jgi:hypothetical protein